MPRISELCAKTLNLKIKQTIKKKEKEKEKEKEKKRRSKGKSSWLYITPNESFRSYPATTRKLV
jgi:hypothetical protein